MIYEALRLSCASKRICKSNGGVGSSSSSSAETVDDIIQIKYMHLKQHRAEREWCGHDGAQSINAASVP